MDSQRSTRDPRFQSGGYYDILKQVATADMDTPIKEATSVISTSVASSSSTGQKTESVEDPAKYFGSSRPSSKREATGSRNYSVPSSFRSPSPSQPSSRSSSISTTSSSVSWRPRFYDPRVKDAHERRQTYECCCRTYLKEESLRQHQLNHMRCEKCGYECLPTLMSRHYVLEHSGDWKDPAPKYVTLFCPPPAAQHQSFDIVNTGNAFPLCVKLRILILRNGSLSVRENSLGWKQR